MSSWTGDVNGDEDDNGDDGFVVTLNEHVENGTTTEIDEIQFVKNLDEVEDVDLLKQAWLQLEGSGHNEKTTLVENRLDELDEAVGDEEDDEEVVDSEPSQPAPESVDDLADSDGEDETEIDESESNDLSADGEGPPAPSGAMSVEEAANIDRRWKMLVWGPPGLFKTHFAYTAPEPVALIDTEGKAHDIAGKFEGKNIQIWQPQDFRESQEALQEAMEWLEWFQENKGQRGTIAIDSMSLIWEWAKTAYKREAYPMDDPNEVTLSSNMGSSQESDWAHIKGMHNSEFREWITNSDFHFAWTAMETEDYGAVMEGESSGGPTPMKPEGEKNNIFKADTILRARKDSEGNKVGDLTKSNFTDRLFVGLDRPTFPKLKKAIQSIEDAEQSDESIKRVELEDEIGVERVVRKDPLKYQQDEDE